MLEPQPAPNARAVLGHHSPSPSPSRAPPAPLGDSVYLGSGPRRRQRPHPPSPVSEQCLHTQPSRTEGLLETRPQQVEASGVSASRNPPRAPHPPRQQYLCRGHPLLPSDTSLPQTSTFQAFPIPTPPREAALPQHPQPQDPLLAHPFTWGGGARPESTPKLASGAQRRALALGLPGSNRPPR